MECLNIIINLLEAARQLPERTGVDSFYLLLGGLVLVLIGASILITLLVWLRYVAGGVLIIVTITGFTHWRRQVCVNEERSGIRNNG